MLDSYIFIPSAITPKIFKTLPVPATLKVSCHLFQRQMEFYA
jgi:hypothetical protein